MKQRLVLLGVLALTMLGCRDRMTCPEFQSRFILDDEYRETFFALFDADSVPKYNADAPPPARTWYGTVEEKNFLERKRELETVPMEKVFAEKEPVDTATFQPDDFVPTGDSLATADSLPAGVDTPTPGQTGVEITSTNNARPGPDNAMASSASAEDKTYNVEQSLYMYYVGAEVMKKREEAYRAWQKAEAERAEEQRIKDSTRYARRQKFLSIFDVFKKKEEEEVVEEEYDPFRDYGEDDPFQNGTPVPSDSTQSADPALPADEEESDSSQ